jgi:hypothetical protein
VIVFPPPRSGGGGPPEGRWRGRRTQRAAIHPPPRQRGRGTALRSRVVEGAQESTRRKSLGGLQSFSLASSCEENSPQRKRSLESRAPSTTVRSLRELQWSPSPAIAGADSASALIPATHPASGSCRPKPPIFCLQKNKGRRSAEKAHQSSVLCGARPRAHRSALAFRRSTAALASAICRSSIQAALRAMQCEGVAFALASRLSEAPRAPVIMPAGSMPGPPESGSDEPPPAGTAPAPSVGVTG